MASMLLPKILALTLAPVAFSLTRQGRVGDLSRAQKADDYFWPEGHGKPGQYGSSLFTGPKDLKASFSWSWHHPKGRFATLPYGTAIDDKKNIYLTTDTSAWKLSPEGEALWSFTPSPRATLFSAGSLLNGRMHFTTLDGRFWAIDMETGKEIWSTKVCSEINHDNGFVSAHEGVVLAASNASYLNPRNGNGLVQAVNATDGSPMWSYKTPVPIWNFMASFPGDGTVLYQDWEGRAYRHNLRSGELIWKAGGQGGSWTDGTPLLGPNGIFYTVQAFLDRPPSHSAGFIEAHRLDDGTLLWQAEVPMPPNNAPALGRLAGHSSLSLVQPGGYQGTQGGPTGIWAYDAQTGAKQWSFIGPSQKKPDQAANKEGIFQRVLNGATTGYVTNPWSAAIIDSQGTVYAGHEDGLFFAISDKNGDGIVHGADEVSTFDTGAAFVGSSSPAIAPGMLAVASCDTLFVFKTADA